MNRQLAQKFAQAPFKGVEFDPFMKIYRNVTDFRYINKFFVLLSQNGYCRREILFKIWFIPNSVQLKMPPVPTISFFPLSNGFFKPMRLELLQNLNAFVYSGHVNRRICQQLFAKYGLMFLIT